MEASWMMYELPADRWPNQVRAFNGALDAIARGVKRLCITSPTGTGKTKISTDLILWATEQKMPVALYTHRKMLFDQTSSVLAEAGILYGERAAGFKPALWRDVQMIMTQTEASRVYGAEARQLHDAKLVLVDELHQNQGPSFLRMMKDHADAGATIIGFTATPLDLIDVDELLVAGTVSEGRACGALVLAETYAPDEPDLKHIKQYAVGEDLSDNDNHKVIMRPGVFGRVKDAWLAHNPEQKPTILFGPDVKGSLFFAEQFYKAGIRAAHIDGSDVWLDGEWHNSDQEIRNKVMELSQAGEIKVVCNRFVCLDSETEILTMRGWVGKDEISHHDRVANWDCGKIFFAPPKEIIRRQRMPNERMVVLETARRSIRVTENHDLLYRTTQDGPFRKTKANTLVNRVVGVPVSGFADASDISIKQPDMTANLARRITMNACAMRKRGCDAATSRSVAESRLRERASLRYKQPSELTLEECQFIGYWIGDGNRQPLKSGGVEYRLWQTTKTPNILRWIDNLCCAIGVDFVRREKPTDAGGTVIQWSLPRGTGFGRQKRRGLFHLEPYLIKTGTDLFWALNTSQFDALLRGLWIADGTEHLDTTELPACGVSICGARQKLFDLLQAIAICRGYRASIRSYMQSNGNGSLLHLSLTKTDEHRLTKYRLEFEDGWKDEEVWCVESTSGNIVTRRKGSVTIMGNCREGVNWPWLGCQIFATVFGSLTAFVQSGGRGLRAYPEKTCCITLDHGGNFHRHGSLNDDREWTLGLTNRVAVGQRQENLREKKPAEPIVCPQCSKVRNGGKECPVCGFVAHKKSRMVVQINGTLRPVDGDIYRQRKTRRLHNEQELWRKMYFRMRRCGRTFRQAEALYFHENHAWPPRDLPLMPQTASDWWRKVRDVPCDNLIQVNSFGPSHISTVLQEAVCG
jgi:superfamily II DNA or RNA helicase